MTPIIIAYFIQILILNFLAIMLIYYTSRLTISIHPVKIIFRGLFMFDFWYLCWFWRWIKKNPFAVFSVPVVICLIWQIIEMGGLLMHVEVFKRTFWMSLRGPIMMGGISGLLYISLRALFPKD